MVTTLTLAPSRRRFYLGMAIAAAAIVLWGFGPTYYLRSVIRIERYPTGRVVASSVPALIHIHAIVSTAWLVLLLAQTTFVAARRIDLHRRLGIAGAAIAVLLSVLGVMTAIRGAKDGWNPGGPFGDALGFFAVTLGDIALFSGFVALGFYWRRRREAHKRLMVFGTLGGLMWPAITRMPYVAPRPLPMFALLLALVLAMPLRDYLVERRLHPVSVWGSVIIIASFPLRTAIGQSAAWHRLAAWILG